MSNKDILVIPKRYSHAKVSDLTDNIKTISVQFLNKVSNYLACGVAPSFFGMSGVGKTHAAAAIAVELRKQDIFVYWCNTLEDLNLLRDYKIFGNSSDYFIEYKRLTRCSVLIMDDITQIAKIDRLKEQFVTIVSKRYNSQLPTIFTGNLQIGNYESLKNALGTSFGAPLIRRIELMSKGLLYLS